MRPFNDTEGVGVFGWHAPVSLLNTTMMMPTIIGRHPRRVHSSWDMLIACSCTPHPTSLNTHLIRSEVGSEGGAVYTVTFEDVVNPGDVSLLMAHSEGLTGEGATAVSREIRKGSEAVGTAVRVGFSAPQHCSTSQVRDGYRFRYFLPSF